MPLPNEGMDERATVRVAVPSLTNGASDAAAFDPMGALGSEDDGLGDILALTQEQAADVVWIVWRRRVPGQPLEPGENPRAPKYVARMVGPLELEALANRVGGGYFKVVGFRNGKKWIERPLDIEGPVKVYGSQPAQAPTSPAAPPASTAAPAPQPPVIEALVQSVTELRNTVRELSQRGGSSSSVKELVELMALMRNMEPQQTPDKAVLDSLLGVLQQGIQIGQGREPGERGGTDWAAVIEKVAPVAERMLSRVAATRAARGRPIAGPSTRPGAPPAGPGQPEPSHAEVVDDSAESADQLRMGAVVDALSRAIADGVEPGDFAATVEMVLSTEQVFMLRAATTSDLLQHLVALAGDRYPILKTPAAEQYVDAVLGILREPDDDAGEGAEA